MIRRFKRPDGEIVENTDAPPWDPFRRLATLVVRMATHLGLKKLESDPRWNAYPPLIHLNSQPKNNFYHWQLNNARGLPYLSSLRWDFTQYAVIVDALMSPAFADLSMDAVIRAVLDGDSALEGAPDQHEPK